MGPEPPTGAQFELVAGTGRAVVTEVGATLRRWTLQGVDVVDGFSSRALGHAYRGKVLMPWPNRLRDGGYGFRGRDHRTPLTEPERGNALHGLVCWVGWRPVRRTGRAVTLAHRLHAQPGYPWTLDLEVTYELSVSGLDVTFRAENVGADAAPFGAGWHPYLATAGAPADAVALELPARAWLPVDARRNPSGPPQILDGGDRDFRASRPVGSVALDTCFAGLARGSDGLARARVARPDGVRVELWMDEAFDHVQVYTGDADPDLARRRRCLAVEPMTCAPDAFNSGDGVVVLEPGDAFTGRCGITVAASDPAARPRGTPRSS